MKDQIQSEERWREMALDEPYVGVLNESEVG